MPETHFSSRCAKSKSFCHFKKNKIQFRLWFFLARDRCLYYLVGRQLPLPALLLMQNLTFFTVFFSSNRQGFPDRTGKLRPQLGKEWKQCFISKIRGIYLKFTGSTPCMLKATLYCHFLWPTSEAPMIKENCERKMLARGFIALIVSMFPVRCGG